MTLENMTRKRIGRKIDIRENHRGS